MSGEWGIGSGKKEIAFLSPFHTHNSPFPFCFLFAFRCLTLDVPAPERYRIEHRIAPSITDDNADIIDVHRNVVQCRAGRERPNGLR